MHAKSIASSQLADKAGGPATRRLCGLGKPGKCLSKKLTAALLFLSSAYGIEAQKRSDAHKTKDLRHTQQPLAQWLRIAERSACKRRNGFLHREAKMNKLAKTLIAACFAAGFTASASATPVSLGGEAPDLQAVINQLYIDAGTSTALAPDVNLNQTDESGWFQIEASGGSVSTMIIEVAGNSSSNTLGIYDIYDPTRRLQLFSGAQGPSAQSILSVDDAFNFSVNFGTAVQFSTSSFGYFLGDTNGPLFYSQASLNGGNDQMVMFQGDGDTIKLPGRPSGAWGSSSFIMAWEDSPLGFSDSDYQDMVVYVESITVPEPGSLALLGLALAGLGVASRRRQKTA